MPDNALLLLAGLPLTAAAAWWVAGWVARNAYRLRLVQAPNHRSSHETPTPTGGGVAIVLTTTVSGGLLMGWDSELGLALVLSAILAVFGLWDDIVSLPAYLRFVLQLTVCGLLLYANMPLPPFSVLAWSIEGGLLLVLLTFAAVWWVNLYNFMDGIDGFAGSQAIFMLVASVLMGFWVETSFTSDPVRLCMVTLAASISGFLVRNWPPAAIFMGDAGSTYIAFMIFALALASIGNGWQSYATWLILGALFVSDATITLVRRIVSGQRWYEPHRSHAYQHLARRWKSHGRVVYSGLAVNLFWLMPLALCSRAWPEWSVAWIALAYGPLLMGMYVLGAGLVRGRGAGPAG